MATAEEHYARAQTVLPGGVTAAARFNRYLDRPFFMSRAEGSLVYDLDDRPFIDMNTSFGATLLGHGHPQIAAALNEAARLGIGCGFEYRAQAELAEKICAAIPSAEMVRFTLSGTETTWYAVRLARVYTGRSKVIKLEGHFHGFNDYLQFNYWPRPEDSLPRIHAESPGFPPENEERVIVLPYNDLPALERAIAEQDGDIAAVFMEPVNFNSGGIQPLPGYLEEVRRITRTHGIVLVFDEILSGFRTGVDCMQGYYGVTPDATTFGKAIGGGVPLSAFAGSRDLMRCVAPQGAMMHSGTYNANAVNILCGNAFFDVVNEPGFYEPLLRRADTLHSGLNDIFASVGLEARAHGVGCRFGLLFGAAAQQTPERYSDVIGQDWQLAFALFTEAYQRGVYFNPGWHHGISAAHSDQDIARVLEVVDEAARAVAERR